MLSDRQIPSSNLITVDDKVKPNDAASFFIASRSRGEVKERGGGREGSAVWRLAGTDLSCTSLLPSSPSLF